MKASELKLQRLNRMASSEAKLIITQVFIFSQVYVSIL